MKKSNFLDGVLVATLSIIIAKVLGVLYVIPFYKMIGSTGGALYGYAYNIYNLFLIISSAGIPLAISKLTSEMSALQEEKQKEYMFKAARKNIFSFSVICFLICFVFAPNNAKLIIGDIDSVNSLSDITFVLRCVSFVLLVVPNLSITRGYLQGHKYIEPASLSQVIEQLVRIIVILAGTYLVLYIFKSDIKVAVGISMLGAGIGAIIAFIYLHKKVNKIKSSIVKEDITKKEKKIIRKRILVYCIPFIIISVANHLYNTTDMILLIKGLNLVGFKGSEIETISSVFTTWGSKLTSIVTAISTGLVISLIPNIVSSYTLKKQDDVNKNFNKALQIILFIVLPISIFTSIFAKEIWLLFYSNNDFAVIIMKYYFLIAFVDGTFTVMCSTLNSLNKFKFIYLIVLVGLGLNAILDVPLILLFDKIGIYPYYGALTATLIGYSISIFMTLTYLHKKLGFEYKPTIKVLPRLIFSIIIMIFICYLFEKYLIVNSSKIMIIIMLSLIGIFTLLVYYLINKKIIDSLIHIKFIDKVKLKLKRS